jgi:hypothetical protein
MYGSGIRDEKMFGLGSGIKHPGSANRIPIKSSYYEPTKRKLFLVGAKFWDLPVSVHP